MAKSHSIVKKVNALKARQNLGKLLEEVYYQGDQFIIERAGKAMAAVVPLWQLEEWQKRRTQLFASVEDVHQRNPKVKPDIIERDVAEALQAIRTTTRRKG
jgi:prevent-host-death family protein